MKICIAQTKPIKGNIEENIKQHLRLIEVAIKHNAGLIAFPELSLTGYEPSLARQLAMSPNDTRLNGFQALCDAHNIIILAGAPTSANSDLRISAIVFQPNKERQVYSKQHLYPTEKEVFSPGCEQLFISAKGHTVVPAICYELSVPSHSANAAANNADIYLAMVLNSKNGVDADLKRLEAIAAKHRMHTFMANYTGISGGYECAGRSSAWTNAGQLSAQLDPNDEGVIIYDTDSETFCKALANK